MSTAHCMRNGAGFFGDQIGPAVALAERGNLDFPIFECLAERTIAHAQQEKLNDPSRRFDPRPADRMQALLVSCKSKRIRIVTNAVERARLAAEIIRQRLRFSGQNGAKPRCGLVGVELIARIPREPSPRAVREVRLPVAMTRAIFATSR